MCLAALVLAINFARCRTNAYEQQSDHDLEQKAIKMMKLTPKLSAIRHHMRELFNFKC